MTLSKVGGGGMDPSTPSERACPELEAKHMKVNSFCSFAFFHAFIPSCIVIYDP